MLKLIESMDNHLTIIKPKNRFTLLDLKEIWRYRGLLYVLAWRDIKVRYKQTLLGVLWALLQPLVTMLIFTVFFGRLAHIPSGNLPYSLFVLCGLVFWTFFSGALTHASSSLVENENLVKKVYFAKVILPLSSVVTTSIDFVINFVILVIYALILGFVPSTAVFLVIPLGVVMTSLTIGGLGLFLASFNVKYRDVRYILPFFIQILMFLTPVIYPLSIVSPTNKLIMAINPLTSVIESTRIVFSQQGYLDPVLAVISAVSSILIFIVGLTYFRRTERFFADIV